MSVFLILTFLFAVGSMIGWGIEVIYRRFVSQKHWVNPGFLTGPCLPLYGMSLCILYLLTGIENHIPANALWLRKLILFLLMAIAITCLEYVVGVVSLKYTKVRLWDYTDQWGNIQGMICPLYSFFWMVLSAIYYFLVHPHILNALAWLSRNLAFSFGIGFFYGIFVIDLAYSAQLIMKIKQFAQEHEIEVRLEEFREDIYQHISEHQKPKFLLSLHTGQPLQQMLEKYHELHFSADMMMEEMKEKLEQIEQFRRR